MHSGADSDTIRHGSYAIIELQRAVKSVQVVYIDVLLIFNLYMNYLLLCVTARLTHRKLRFRRGLAGAGLGSFSALMLFLPEMPELISILLKILTAVLICLVTFGRQGILWSSSAFAGASFLTAGALMALSMCSQMNMVHANASWYLDISLFHLIVFTIMIYMILSVIQYVYDRFHASEGSYQVKIRYKSASVEIEGLADTGNALVDFYTGKPVIICDRLLLGGMSSPEHSHYIPYLTVAGSGMLQVFEPDEVKISLEREMPKTVDALIGIGGQENGKAIFNPKLLRY